MSLNFICDKYLEGKITLDEDIFQTWLEKANLNVLSKSLLLLNWFKLLCDTSTPK